MVGRIDVKRKRSLSVSVGYWISYVTLSFDLTYDLDLGCFKVKFRNSCISGIVGLIDVKWKGSELIWHWAGCITLLFNHTHDLDLGVSRSKSEIALSQEWGVRLTWNKKDLINSFMTVILTSMTMVGWADVPDSDRGDFRPQRAIDISNFLNDKNFINQINYAHINTFHKKGHWFKMELLWLTLAKIELICQHPTMSQLSGVHPSSGVLEKMAGGSQGQQLSQSRCGHIMLTIIGIWQHLNMLAYMSASVYIGIFLSILKMCWHICHHICHH